MQEHVGLRVVPRPHAARSTMKRAVIGAPRSNDQSSETLLSKTLALPIFASDPLSSVAYATEAAMVVLVAASASALGLAFPIAVAIAALLGIVVLSYRQTIRAYQTSGGAYVVARDNLGRLPSLLAAAALLVDYILTVAVSVAAGVLALTSAAPELEQHKVAISLGFIALLTLVNLRGVRESGLLFAAPTYAFVAAMYALVLVGSAKCATGSCPIATVPDPVAAGTGAVGLVVVLRAFASGAAALTGVEAISNGVGAFRPPQARNAATTLTVMGAIAITLFIGVSYLAVATEARPSESVSLLSEIARAVFPAGSATSPLYYAVQGLTFAILVLAANTAYQGFPRLAAVLARDGYFPRQFVNRGDRLVYSNGVVILAAIAGVLVWTFHANVFSLIHLYVTGVFTAFTLSQAGMVRLWFRRRSRWWRRSAAINATGAVATGVVTLLVIQTKFLEGAWMVTIAIPVLIVLSLVTHRHYRSVTRRLRAGAAAIRTVGRPQNTVVVYVETLDAATAAAVRYARAIADGSYHAVAPRSSPALAGWRDFTGGGVEIKPLDDTGESPTDAFLDYVWRLPRSEQAVVTAVLPEAYERRSIVEAVVGRRALFLLKWRLLDEPGVVVTNVPVFAGESPPVPRRVVGRVLVSGVHASSLRAVHYAQALGLDDVRAVFFAFDEDEATAIAGDWRHERIEFPLDVVQAPYRDLGEPLLAYLRELTEPGDTLVSVVMPELVVHGWRRLLHNQRALYVKRLLLFEPHVLLSSVPYQLP